MKTSFNHYTHGLLVTFFGTLLFGSAAIAAASSPASDQGVLVDMDLPLSPAELPVQSPAFAPFSLGASTQVPVKHGNWTYQLTYDYGQQGWRLTQYVADRIHPSKMQPVRVYPSSNPPAYSASFCPPTMPQAQSGHGQALSAHACGGGQSNGLPDIDHMPPPADKPGKGGGITITYPCDTQGANGWHVIIKWESQPIVSNGVITGWKWVPVHVEADPSC